MSGIDEVLEEFDILFATPIHDGPSIGSGLTQGAPRRSSGSWARPSDAGFSQGRQIARCLLARGASSLAPHASQGKAANPGHASSVAHLAFSAYFMHARSGRARGSPLSSDAGWRIAGRAPLRSTGQGWQQTQPCPAKPRSRPRILDNPTTNAPPPRSTPVPQPSSIQIPASSELGTQNTDACTAVPSRASIERTWMVPLLPQLARTECLSPRRGHCHSPCTPKQPAMRCIAASDQLQLMTCSRVPACPHPPRGATDADGARPLPIALHRAGSDSRRAH